MAEHVDEVDYDNVQVVRLQRIELLQELVGAGRVVYLMVREGFTAPVTLELRLDQRSFVKVLAFLFVLVDPQVGKHLGYLDRHEAAEYGVTGVLRSRRQYADVGLLVNIEHVAYFLRQHAPLVETEVVDDNHEDLFARIEQREYFLLEYVDTHHGAFLALVVLLQQ